jgi:hypothetical protein
LTGLDQVVDLERSGQVAVHPQFGGRNLDQLAIGRHDQHRGLAAQLLLTTRVEEAPAVEHGHHEIGQYAVRLGCSYKLKSLGPVRGRQNQAIRDLLEDEGFAVLTHDDLETGCSFLRQQHPDPVLVDIL